MRCFLLPALGRTACKSLFMLLLQSDRGLLGGERRRSNGWGFPRSSFLSFYSPSSGTSSCLGMRLGGSDETGDTRLSYSLGTLLTFTLTQPPSWRNLSRSLFLFLHLLLKEAYSRRRLRLASQPPRYTRTFPPLVGVGFISICDILPNFSHVSSPEERRA